MKKNHFKRCMRKRAHILHGKYHRKISKKILKKSSNTEIIELIHNYEKDKENKDDNK